MDQLLQDVLLHQLVLAQLGVGKLQRKALSEFLQFCSIGHDDEDGVVLQRISVQECLGDVLGLHVEELHFLA